MTKTQDLSGIAIIGMACRLPGADNLAAFWHNLCAGTESITVFSDDDLLAAGVEPAVLQHPDYIKAAPILNDVDKFDAAFFAFSPKEAAMMDPQHRFLLEVAWAAFEDAGYHPPACEGRVGVYCGSGGVMTTYLMAHRDQLMASGETAGVQHMGNDKDFLSTRVSYKLNLTGPSVTVQTACSTSLVAVHLACQSLMNGECDMALAGASTIRVPHMRGYWVEKGNIHSMDGHCRAFDAAGQGTIFGSGVAAVLLKDVRRAVADGDPIYAVIKGTAINNDGAVKVSYTAPSATGQAGAMIDALTHAHVSPETVGYVECHATGTIVGDPLEIQALTHAFHAQTARTQFCAIGSVKTNIGHPEQTAGLAGLIKTALILKHQCIPPSLHFETPNPNIDFEQSPFYVNTTLRAWPANGAPRRAAVNSLGIGGTNAFAVLEEAPGLPRATLYDDRAPHLFCLSAKTREGLRAQAAQLEVFLSTHDDLPLADICYTSNISRSAFVAHRFAITVDSVVDLQTQLNRFDDVASDPPPPAKAPPVAFLFTGQGSQYPGMASELYHTQPVFREALEACGTLLRPHLNHPLLDVIFASEDHAALLHETAYTQPALFAVEYALAQLWQAWGVVPDVVMGHSIGELTAACVAGVLDLETALGLVAERGRLMQSLPKDGAMAVVFAAEREIQDILAPYRDRVAIAAVNSPLNTVISGEQMGILQALEALKAQHIASTSLNVSHAFHSPLMAPILDAFEQAAQQVASQVPRIPLVSNLTGGLLESPPDARYWRDHIREPVRFADGMRTLQELGCELFIEIGPGRALLGMGRQCLPQDDATWLASIGKPQQDRRTTLESLRQLYLAGFNINWQAVDQGLPRRRVSLPTYPFQRKRYWLDDTTTRAPRVQTAIADGHPLLGTRLRSALKESQFEAVYSLGHLPFMADHQIYGQPVLPTTAGLEALLAAGQAHFGARQLMIEHLIYHEALVLPENRDRFVQTILTPEGVDKAAFQLLSTDMDGPEDWRVHLSGVLHQTGMPDAAAMALDTTSVEALQQRGLEAVPADQFYRTVLAQGLAYDTAFRGIQQLWRSDHEAVSYVRLPASLAAEPYALHPALLDACLHTYLALSGDSASMAYLPIGIKRFRLYQTHVTEAWSHVTLRQSPDEDRTLMLDIGVYDTAGELVAAFDGVSARQLPPEMIHADARPLHADWLYQLRWEAQPPAPSHPATTDTAQGGWLIFADSGGVGDALAQRLRERGESCDLVLMGSAFGHDNAGSWTIDVARPEDFHRLLREVAGAGQSPCRTALYLWGLDVAPAEEMSFEQLEQAETEVLGGALRLSQALAEARAGSGVAPRLWLITRNAQHVPDAPPAPLNVGQAPLWGFGRTVQIEHPQLWGGLIDLPPMHETAVSTDADALLEAIGHWQAEGEDQVALRQGQRFVARLGRLALTSASPHAVPFRQDATYLITGGLGGLGLKIAQWLVHQQGVRYLVLTGRRGAQGEARKAVDALIADGAHVRVIQADVTVAADVQRILDELQQDLPPLKGVFHCAGVLADGILSQFDFPTFTRATAPKIKGGWLLHHYTQGMELDVFVLLSSVLSLIGSAGQANYTAGNAFLDALAAHRRALGLPAIAMNFGPWDEAGMATSAGARGEAMWESRGMGYIAPDAGIRVLEDLVHRPFDHAAVTLTDWSVYLGQLPVRPPLYADLAREALARQPQSNAPTAEDVQRRLQEAGPAEQKTIVMEVVHQHIMSQLGFEEAIDTRQPLNELGLDSLMSVNVVNRLEAILGISIPVVNLIQGPSLDQFIDGLLPALAGPEVMTSPAPDVIRTSRNAGNGWLVTHKPMDNARLRLFCFPFAGGGAATSRPWAETLEPWIEVVGVEPPGRASRIHEPPLSTMEAFLSHLVPVMLPYLEDKPFAFYGHCLGGLTLFETARTLLEDYQLRAEHLFVSAARPPHRGTQIGPFEEAMLADVLNHDKFDPFLPPYEQPDEVFMQILRHFRLDATEEFLQLPELRHLLLPTIRAEFAMASNYQCPVDTPWDIPITCFNGIDDAYVTRADAMAWGRFTKSAFSLHMREGDHFLVVGSGDYIVQTIKRELSA